MTLTRLFQWRVQDLEEGTLRGLTKNTLMLVSVALICVGVNTFESGLDIGGIVAVAVGLLVGNTLTVDPHSNPVEPIEPSSS